MKTGAKDLVTTARTIHLPEQQKTIHMISTMRKEAGSGSIQDFAHIPHPNCLADCLTKASAKADNLITAEQTGKLLDVDIHPDFRTLMEHNAFLSTWCKTFLHKRTGSLLPEHTQGFFCTNSRRRIISGDVCGDQQTKEQKELITHERKVQDATKITSAYAASCFHP